jgi:hypothetical protein
VPLLEAQKDESTAEQSPGPSAAGPPPKAAAPEVISSESLARNPFARGKVIIFFLYNSNELTPEGLAALDRIAEFLKANPHLKAEIRGYTDSVGAVNYNVSVSAFRANSIKSYQCKGSTLPASSHGAGAQTDRSTTPWAGAEPPRIERVTFPPSTAETKLSLEKVRVLGLSTTLSTPPPTPGHRPRPRPPRVSST